MGDAAQKYATAERLINALRYAAPARVKADVYAVLHQVPFLSPLEGQLTKPGAPPTKLLCLDGTIQTYYQGVAYQTPVCIYIPEVYPNFPPIVYLRPAPTMYIVQGHPNVDPSGLVYMPYLAEWQAQSSNIPNLIACMSGVFSDKPPLRLRTAADPPPATGGWGATPPAVGPAATRPPAPAPAPAPAPRPTVAAPKTERERRADLIAELTPVLQGQLQDMLVAVRE